MSEQGMFGGRLLERIMSGPYEHPEVEEYVYADIDDLTTETETVQEGTVPDGHEGIIVAVAVSSVSTAVLYLERDGKQYYENGLNCKGLSRINYSGADQEGVDTEVPLLIRLKEKGKWKLQFKATAGTPTLAWRLRVRHFKKK